MKRWITRTRSVFAFIDRTATDYHEDFVRGSALHEKVL